MKTLAVCSIVLLVGVLGFQQGHQSRFDVLWALGVLAIGAYVLQRVARRLHLPVLVGWVVAGLLVGASGLRLVPATGTATLELMRALAAIWIGFQVGIHFSWPRGFGWRGPLLIGAVTLATLLLATAGIALATRSSWWIALLLGAIAAMWGPFTMLPTPARRGILLLSILGSGFSLVFLCVVLILLQTRGFLTGAAFSLVGRLGLSLAAGALGAELLRRFSLFSARTSTLAVGLFGVSFIAALFVQHMQLYALPCGFGAGLVLVRRRTLARRMRIHLRSLPPIAFMIFFVIMGAAVDLRILWPPVEGLPEVLLVQILVLVLVRGIGPAIYYPFSAPIIRLQRRIGWLLLPRGALLLELLYHPQSSLLGLLRGNPALLLHQAVLADILIHVLFFSTMALAVQHLFPPAAAPPLPDDATAPGSAPSL